jgi:hypothetical protein
LHSRIAEIVGVIALEMSGVKMFLGYNFSIMLKSLAILVLAFNVFPMQTYAQTNEKQQTSNSDKPSTPIAPVAPQQKYSPQLQPKDQNHVQADVRVISAPNKDGYDRAAFYVNLALAIVEADRRIEIPPPPTWISRTWATYKAWQAKIEAEYQSQSDDPN